MISEKMIFNDFDQMTFAFQQDFGLYILLGAIVFGFILSFAVIPPFSLDPFLQKGSSLQVENLSSFLSVCLSVITSRFRI